MKKLIAILAVSLLLFGAVAAYADPMDNFVYGLSSGEQVSSAAVATGASLITGVLVLTDGTNAGTIIVYDNTSAAGTKVFEAVVTGASNFGGATFEIPIYCATGIYGAISGTGASFIIWYRKASSKYKIPVQ